LDGGSGLTCLAFDDARRMSGLDSQPDRRLGGGRCAQDGNGRPLAGSEGYGVSDRVGRLDGLISGGSLVTGN
jgi:hypothetical protein